MEFFKMNFATLFLEKHGRKIYNLICNKIKEESPSEYNEKYVSIVFKVAFLDYFGMENYQIGKMIKKTERIDKVDIDGIKKNHRISISEIEKYLINTNNCIEDEK